VLIHEIQTLREQKGFNDDKKRQSTGDADATPSTHDDDAAATPAAPAGEH
jgi:hypothetical protein